MPNIVDEARKQAEINLRKKEEAQARNLKLSLDQAAARKKYKDDLLLEFEINRNHIRREMDLLMVRLQNDGLQVETFELNQFHYLDYHGNFSKDDRLFLSSRGGINLLVVKWKISYPGSSSWTEIELSFKHMSRKVSHLYGLFSTIETELWPSTNAKQAEILIQDWLAKIFSS